MHIHPHPITILGNLEGVVNYTQNIPRNLPENEGWFLVIYLMVVALNLSPTAIRL